MTDRKRKQDSSDLGQQSNTERVSRTNIEQDDRNMEAGSLTDENAGSEGVEDQALERSHRESMEEAEE